jgi:hypothetical protein
MFILFRWDVSCFVTGLFLHHVAGVLETDGNVCDRATVFVALTETHIVHNVFRRMKMPPDIFNFDGYTFSNVCHVATDSFVS